MKTILKYSFLPFTLLAIGAMFVLIATVCIVGEMTA